MVKNRNCREASQLGAVGIALQLWVRQNFGTARDAAVDDRAGAVMDWALILAYAKVTVDQELLARNEYLAADNRILKAQLNGRPELSDAAA